MKFLPDLEDKNMWIIAGIALVFFLILLGTISLVMSKVKFNLPGMP